MAAERPKEMAGVIVQKLVKDTSAEEMVARLGRAPRGVHVSIGIPKGVAFTEADRILGYNLAKLGLVAVLALAALL